MTELRDARLRQALQAAPDADARPLPAVADAIRAAARQALPPQAVAKPVKAQSAPWWQRLWQSTGSPRAPWNAAFATVLLAVLVTVMWRHEPIPDARPLAPAPIAAPAPAPIATPAPVATATAPANAPAARSDTVKPSVTQPATARAEVKQRATAEATLPQSPATQEKARAQESMADSLPDAQRKLAAAPAPAPAPAPEQAPAPAPAVVAAVPVAPMSRSAATATTAAAGATANGAFAAPAQASLAIAGLDAWTHLSVQRDAQSAMLTRAQGRRLSARLEVLALRLALEPATTVAVPAVKPDVRLTVLSKGEVLATLFLWDNTALWQRPGQPDVRGRITPTEAQDIQMLLEQALAASAEPTR